MAVLRRNLVYTFRYSPSFVKVLKFDRMSSLNGSSPAVIIIKRVILGLKLLSRMIP